MSIHRWVPWVLSTVNRPFLGESAGVSPVDIAGVLALFAVVAWLLVRLTPTVQRARVVPAVVGVAGIAVLLLFPW